MIFWFGTKSLGLAQYLDHLLFLHNYFETAHNILVPVERQGRKLMFLTNFEGVTTLDPFKFLSKF